MTEYNKIKNLLHKNGWESERAEGEEYRTFINPKSDVAFSTNTTEIVFLNGQGDFLHCPVNFFHVLGAMIHLRIVGVEYISPSN